MGQQLGIPVTVMDQGSYAEINRQLELGNIDVAFACSSPYVKGHEKFGLELLVAPQAYGDTVYYSYIIVPQDSPIKSFEELRGKSFAFVDPWSNTGKLFPTFLLAKMNETPDSFFNKYIYSYAHDKSIVQVAQKEVEGAAVDSLVWEYFNKTNPEYTSKTRVILKSEPYGIPPVVVRPHLAPELKEQLKQTFLNMHQDEKGKQILKEMQIDQFVPIENSAYDSIRDMMSKMKELQEKKP